MTGVGARWWQLLMVGMAAALSVMLWAAASARAENCSLADYDYNGACGPEYQSPSWGDDAGWTNPSQYSTIQLADITGNGQDELLARNSDGLEIWRFDTTLGQWVPAVGADGLPEVLTDFRSPLPNKPSDNLGTNPMVYSTIQTADVLGNGTESIVAQFQDGTHTYDYVPPAGTKDIDGGKWLEEPVSGPKGQLSPSQYLSERVTDAEPNVSPATLTIQDAFWFHQGNGVPGTSGWSSTGKTTQQAFLSDPEYYLDNRTAVLANPNTNAPQSMPVKIYRTADGVGWQVYDPHHDYCSQYPEFGGCTNDWVGEHFNWLDEFNEDTGFGDNPSYYETFQTATHLEGPTDNDTYVLGRLSDGLHMLSTFSGGFKDWYSGPVLTALANPTDGSSMPPGEWSSIRTGDVTGDGSNDVLAVVDGKLQAWQLTSNGSGGWEWSQLSADVPLDLGTGFENDASEYSTIQVGPVAGPGYPDGVIARGPFGIRTWFYCVGKGASHGDVAEVPGCASLDGQSGWTSFEPQGAASYPQFTGGEAAAWTELNALARNPPAPTPPLIGTDETTVRDVWTATNPPSSDRLTNLNNGIVLLGNCSGETSAAPPTYGRCTPPAGSSFTAADWTTVINETLADIYAAQQVLTYYDDLGTMRQDAFMAEGAALPAIADKISALDGAAGNSNSMSPQAMVSTGLGIAGALAGLANPVVGAALGIASYVLAAIPSATSDLSGSAFPGTVSDLQNKFAEAVGSEDKAEETESYDVRGNWGLLRMISQLTEPSGPWNSIDYIGLKSAMEEGYVLYVYQKLLPTIYSRYVITDCHNNTQGGAAIDCQLADWAGLYYTNTNPYPDFTTIESPPDGDTGFPCTNEGVCLYNQPPPDSIANQVWGPVSDNCNYNGKPETAWTYGCNLGIRPDYSTSTAGEASGWHFETCTGDPDIGGGINIAPNCTQVSDGDAAAGSDASLQVDLSASLPRGFEVKGATLDASRLLDRSRASGSLLSLSTSHGLGADRSGVVKLKLTKGKQLGASSGALLHSSGGEAPATMTVHAQRGGRTKLDLSLGDVDVAAPEACEQLPPAVSLSAPQFFLYTTVKVSDGKASRTISVPGVWTCELGADGAITRLHTVAQPEPAERPGLAVSMAGPRTVRPGTRASFRIRLRNTRGKAGSATISSLWGLSVSAGLTSSFRFRAEFPITRRVAELRRGRTRTLTIRIRIPAALRRRAGNRICASVLANAQSARPASAKACARIGSS